MKQKCCKRRLGFPFPLRLSLLPFALPALPLSSRSRDKERLEIKEVRFDNLLSPATSSSNSPRPQARALPFCRPTMRQRHSRSPATSVSRSKGERAIGYCVRSLARTTTVLLRSHLNSVSAHSRIMTNFPESVFLSSCAAARSRPPLLEAEKVELRSVEKGGRGERASERASLSCAFLLPFLHPLLLLLSLSCSSTTPGFKFFGPFFLPPLFERGPAAAGGGGGGGGGGARRTHRLHCWLERRRRRGRRGRRWLAGWRYRRGENAPKKCHKNLPPPPSAPPRSLKRALALSLSSSRAGRDFGFVLGRGEEKTSRRGQRGAGLLSPCLDRGPRSRREPASALSFVRSPRKKRPTWIFSDR